MGVSADNSVVQTKRFRHRGLGFISGIAALAVALLGLGVAPATAATGSVTSFVVTTAADGVAAPLDPAEGNGVIATNNYAIFGWEFFSPGAEDLVFEQRLPKGWTWDENTFDAVNRVGPEPYSASYVLSTDPVTEEEVLTVTVDVVPGNTAQVRLGNLAASPSPSVANGSVYTPTVTVLDGNGTQTQSGSALTVVSENKMDVSKRFDKQYNNGTNGIYNHDFRDGDGSEVAERLQYVVNVMPVGGSPAIGAREVVLQSPIEVTDTYTFSGDVDYAEIVYVRSYNGYSVTVDSQSYNAATDTGTVTFKITGQMDPAPTNGITIMYQLAVPSHDAPPSNGTAYDVTNEVSSPLTLAGGGNAVDVDLTNNKSTSGKLQSTDPGGALPRYTAKSLNTPKPDPTTPLPAGERPSNANVNSTNSQAVAAGSYLYPAIGYAAQLDQNGDVIEEEDLTLYDFWNPSEQELVSPLDDWAGTNGGGKFTLGTEYQLEFTTDYDPANPTNTPPDAMTWSSWASISDKSTISGARFVYLSNGGTWDYAGTPGDAASRQLWWYPEFKLISTTTEAIEDRAYFASTTVGVGGATERYVYVTGSRLRVSKTSDRTSVPSGDSIEYTLNPTLYNAYGVDGGVSTDIGGLKIVDTLPPEILAVDTSGVDSAWSVDKAYDPATGWTLTFSYVGTANTQVDPPSITYVAETPVKAPSTGSFASRAVISASGNNESESTRSSTRNVTVSQSQIAGAKKYTVGSEEIDINDTFEYSINWFNFLSSTSDNNEFYDLLPYNGDANGSVVNGEATFMGYALTGDALTSMTSPVVQYTTDPRSTLLTAADMKAATWVDASDPSIDLNDVTGVRVYVDTMDTGYFGGIDLKFSQSDAHVGDLYKNSLYRYVDNSMGVNVFAGQSGVVGYEVTGSTISGQAWWDVDQDGVRETGEGPVAGVGVTVVDKNDSSKTWTTTTDASGMWSVENVGKATYLVDVDYSGISGSKVGLTSQDAGGDDTLDSDFSVAAPNRVEVEVSASDSAITGVDAGLIDASLTLDKNVKENATSSTFISADPSETAGQYAWGETVTWQIEITNNGKTNVNNAVVTDDVEYLTSTSAECSALSTGHSIKTIAPGETVTIECDADAVRDLTNEATVAADNVDEITDTAAIEVKAAAELTVQKQVEETEGSGTWVESADRTWGEASTWRIRVTNSGTVPLSDVRMADVISGNTSETLNLDSGSSTACQALADPSAYQATSGGLDVGTLGVGDSYTVECVSTEEQSLENIAWAAGNFVAGPGIPAVEVTDEDTASLNIASNPSIAVEKQVEETEGSDDWVDAATRIWGGASTWKIVVTNTGDVPLSDVRVADVSATDNSQTLRLDSSASADCQALADPAAYEATSGGLSIGALEVGEQFEIECSSTERASLENLAWATGDFTAVTGGSAVTVTDEDTADVTITYDPQLTIETTVEETPGSGIFVEEGTANWGDEVIWKIVVRNNGDVPLTKVTVSDAIEGADTDVTLARSPNTTPACEQIITGAYRFDGPLEAGGEREFLCHTTADRSVVELATARGEFDPGTGIDAIARVAVDPAELEVDDSRSATIEKFVQNGPGASDFIPSENVDDAPVFDEGDEITWRIVVVGTGRASLENLTVTDPGLENLVAGSSDDCQALVSSGVELSALAYGEEVTFECTTTANSTFENVATLGYEGDVEASESGASRAIDGVATAAAIGPVQLSNSAWVKVNPTPAPGTDEGGLSTTGGNGQGILFAGAGILLAAGMFLALRRRREA